MSEPLTYKHPDGSKLEIYPDRKVKTGYYGTSIIGIWNGIEAIPFTSEWYSPPGIEWKREVRI